MTNLTRSLSHRPFALLWSGQTISRLGDSLYRIALIWWIVEKTGSAVTAGSVQIFSMVPMLVFLLIGGVMADRLPRVRVMFGSDVLRAVLVGGVALLAALNALEVWHVFVASVVFGFVDAFFQPAYVAILPEITPAELLPSANSLTSLSMTLTGIIGPALGALIFKLSGASAAFGLDMVSFLVSAACLLPILGLLTKPKNDGPRGSPLRDLREGLRVTFSQPWLWISIAFFGFANMLLAGPTAIALPFLVDRVLKANVDTLGLFYSLSSFGSIVGALLIGRSRKLRRRGLVMYGATALTSLSILVMGALPITWVVGLSNLVFGLTVAIFGLIWTNTLQEMVPGDLLGRVSSVDQFGSFILLPLGYALTGWLTDRFSVPLVFIGCGLVSVIASLAIMLLPAIRNLD